MAKKSAPKSPNFQGYVPVYLDDKAKKAIKANIPSDEDILKRVNQWLEDEYRVTIQWSEYHDCIQCSLFDISMRRPSGGYVLAAHHVDLHVAFGSLAYLHEKVFADGWDIERVGQQSDVSW